MIRFSVRALLFMSLVFVAGCSWFRDADEEPPVTGARIPVLETAKKLEVDADAKNITIDLPLPEVNNNWPQAGGNPQHAVGNVVLGPKPSVIWRADIGDGSSKYFRLLAQPVVNDGKVFTIDSRGEVTAFHADTGERLWRFDTTPLKADGESMGAGVAATDQAVFATTGYGEVLALNPADGKPLWRNMIGKPFRSPPVVSDGRVYAVTIDNELHALSAENGTKLWHHNGMAESASLLGAAAPAVDGDSLVVAYSSGEIFNLRTLNGRVAWADLLAVPEKMGALPAIADIRGLPVISRGGVFAVSHSGRMAAIDQRTGDRAWEANVGGVNTPAVAGDVVFIITNNSELVALARQNGRLLWIKELQKLKDQTDRDSKPVFWTGPVLAGGRLWAANSLGHMLAFSPNDGTELDDIDVGGAFFIPPVVANATLYLLDDSGRLIAMK